MTPQQEQPPTDSRAPRTAAGRALDTAGGWYDEIGTYVRCTDLTAAILAIEAEAAADPVAGSLDLDAIWEHVRLEHGCTHNIFFPTPSPEEGERDHSSCGWAHGPDDKCPWVPAPEEGEGE